MPFQIEHEGKSIKVWTDEEVQAEIKGLKITCDNLKTEKQEVTEKLRETKELARELEEAKAKAIGDNDTLRKIADERESEKRKAVEDERKKFSDLLMMTKQEKVANFIDSILDEVKTADNIKRKQLKKLLRADYEFDVDLEKGEFKVTGDSVTSKNDLIRVLRESEEYQGFLAGSGATGGGATGRSAPGVSKKFNEYTGAELSAIRKDNPAEYERLKTAYHGT